MTTISNPIGVGTRNVAVNWLCEERDLIARVAFSQDISFSEYIRKAVAQSLEQSHPREAALLKSLRDRRRAQRLKITIRAVKAAQEVAS